VAGDVGEIGDQIAVGEKDGVDEIAPDAFTGLGNAVDLEAGVRADRIGTRVRWMAWASSSWSWMTRLSPLSRRMKDMSTAKPRMTVQNMPVAANRTPTAGLNAGGGRSAPAWQRRIP